MDTSKPLKRDKNLQPFSRDHHHTLLLCWKIRKGFSKGIATERIKQYADWFYTHHVLPHFELEEKYIFPILGTENKLIKKALSEHRRIQKLFEQPNDVNNALSLLEEELEQHVRFEERVLFPEIQKTASEEQLELVAAHHSDERFEDNLSDAFWK